MLSYKVNHVVDHSVQTVGDNFVCDWFLMGYNVQREEGEIKVSGQFNIAVNSQIYLKGKDLPISKEQWYKNVNVQKHTGVNKFCVHKKPPSGFLEKKVSFLPKPIIFPW